MLGDHPFDYTSDSSLGIVHIAYISTTRFVNIHHVFSVIANDRDLESILTLQPVSPVLEGQSVVNPLRVTLWTPQMRVTATLRSSFFRSSGSSDERVSNSGPAHSHHKGKLFSDEANPEEHSPCRSDDELSPKSMSAVIQTKQTLILVDRMMSCLQNRCRQLSRRSKPWYLSIGWWTVSKIMHYIRYAYAPLEINDADGGSTDTPTLNMQMCGRSSCVPKNMS